MTDTYLCVITIFSDQTNKYKHYLYFSCKRCWGSTERILGRYAQNAVWGDS